MLPSKHTASRKKGVKQRANLCLPIYFYILRHLTLHSLTEAKNVLYKYMDFTHFYNYQLKQSGLDCKLRKLLAIAGGRKAIIRKGLHFLFLVYNVLFLSICSYWLLSETLQWDGWGSFAKYCSQYKAVLF